MNEGVRVTRMGQFGDTTYTKVFVGGLAWETQKETMRRYFEQFGEILEAVVITDKNSGRSKGYGFVTFKDPESATRACQDASPIIDGRRTNCNLASLGAQRPRIVTPGARYRLWSSSTMPSYNAGAFQLHHHGSSSATSYYHLGATHPTFSHHTPPYFHQGFPYYGYASYSAPDSSFHPNFYGAPQAPQMYAAAPGVMTNPAYYPYFQQGSSTATPAPTGGSSATSQNYGINPYPQPSPLFHYGGLASATHISNVPHHHHHQPFISLPQSTGMTLGLAARSLYSMPTSSAASIHSGSTSEHS